MSTEATIDRERLATTESISPFGPRASWAAILAGAVTMLAIALLLWSLAAAIVSLTSSADTPAQVNVVVLWICAMVVTLLGALGGGYAAGFFSRQGWPALGALHGFVSWGVALLAAFVLQFSVAKTFLTTMAQMEPEIAGSSLEVPNGSTEPQNGSTIAPDVAPSRGDLLAQEHARDRMNHGRMIALSWSWFGTWFVAGILAAAAGGLGARSLRGGRPWTLTPTTNDDRRPRNEPPRVPVTPAPTH